MNICEKSEYVKKTLSDWFVVYGLSCYNPTKFKEVTNEQDYLNKPEGGLWSSPANSEWGWKDWCDSEMWRKGFGLSCGFKFKLKKSARIFAIDSLSDYRACVEKYGKGIRWSDRKVIDWEKISKEYDGLFLTLKGFDETRIGLDGFHTWDCESMVIFNLDCVSEVKSLRRCELIDTPTHLQSRKT